MTEPSNTEPEAPVNPFPVTDHFKLMTPGLLHAVIESAAYVSLPILGEPTPARLIIVFVHEWAKRMTAMGEETISYAVTWELSALVRKLANSDVPFPPFDITTKCDDYECTVDHSRQVRVVNDFLTASAEGDHAAAVKAYVAYVHELGAEDRQEGRAQYLAMLVTHVAERVCDFRTNSVDELPSLD